MVTRLRAGIVKPNPKYAFKTVTDDVAEPSNVQEAISQSGWLEATKDEIRALEDNHTWDLVPKLPDMNIIRTK